MKKLLSALSAIMVVASSASSVVSCGKPKTFKDITLITDTGKISDKSFNESGYNAGNDFVEVLTGKSGSKIRYNEPGDKNQLQSSYSKAVSGGAKTLILPGFQHQENIETASKVLGNSKDAVFIDGDTNGASNVIGLKYKSDISGFMAGLSSIIWYFQNHKEATKIKLGAYGGIANAIAVTPYLTGFFASIDAFNVLIQKEDFKTKFKLEDRTLTAARTKTQTVDAPSGDGDTNFFTNSFSQGDGKTISDHLIDDGAQVIFPVAGPQTLDTLGEIKDKGLAGKVFVDGVDTDQILSYGSYASSFITSGMKNIKGSTEVALAHTVTYKDQIGQDKLDKLAEKGNVDISKATFVDGKDDTEISDTTDLMKAGSSWDGKEIWFDGDIAHGNGNKIDDNFYKTFTEYLNGIDLTKASAEFFNVAQQDGTESKTLLSKDTINTWLSNAGIQKS